MLPALCLLVLGSLRADAWPAELSRQMAKDALRLLPKSLAEVIAENEVRVFAEAQTARPDVLRQIYLDLPQGRLSPTTIASLDREFGERARALRSGDFRPAVIALGGTYRLVVDIADPALGLGGSDPLIADAIRREFYSFVTANHDRIPLVIADPGSLGLRLGVLPRFLAETVARTPEQAARLLAEGQEGGRVLPFSGIDFTSPVFAVASAAYSRSVGAVAATWIAIWRSAGGDMSRPRLPHLIKPGSTPYQLIPYQKDL